jgi:hypothetical protein
VKGAHHVGDAWHDASGTREVAEPAPAVLDEQVFGEPHGSKAAREVRIDGAFG